MRLRDLIGGGEPAQVMERSGSRGLRLWDHLATRVVPLQGRKVASGVLMVFGHRESEALRAALRRIRRRAPREADGVSWYRPPSCSRTTGWRRGCERPRSWTVRGW
jgi:hypothetical protein